MSEALQVIDTRNPKEIIMNGLRMKVDEAGDLRVGFDITSDYPSRETYETQVTQDNYVKRRIVVRKLSNSVNPYALGVITGGETDFAAKTETESFGWVDVYNMEVSVWSPDSHDRDNIVELVKLWFIELEQNILPDGYPYFFSKGIFSSKFIREYEGQNDTLIRNGTIYIGTLVYEMQAPFFFNTQQDLEKYKVNIIARLVNSLKVYV